MHVTQRIADSVLTGAGLRTLCRRDVYKILHRAFVHGCKRDAVGGNFRICQFSVQRDHLHLIVEADSKAALSRGMQAFAIRVAKAINGFLGRRGQVFDDRYHAEVATNPRQTRNVVRYVLLNARKARRAHPRPAPLVGDLRRSVLVGALLRRLHPRYRAADHRYP